jgi:excisionase family DNA binding protein
MSQEGDYYSAHEAARLLGLSPARVRQMLRAGELEGERGPERMEGVPGPWRIPAAAVSAYMEAHQALEAAEAQETVALPRQEILPSRAPQAPRLSPEGQPQEEKAPSESTERLSEGLGALRDKIEEIIEELDLLESRLEAAEVEHIGVREAASREKERAEKLQAELKAQRAGKRGERPGTSWRRRLFGGLSPGGEIPGA